MKTHDERMMINKEDKKDAILIVVIGVALGLLVQPIISNNLPALMADSLFRFYIFCLLVILAPLCLALARLLSYASAGIYQFAKFCAVGVLNSVIDIGIFNLETFLYAAPVGNVLFACFKAISFLFATTNSFFWNRTWTFSARRKDNRKEVISFYVIAVLGWVLNVGVATAVKALGPASGAANVGVWTNIYAPLTGIAASFLWNFFGYKYFVFKKS